MFLKGAQLIMHSIRLVVVSTLAVQMRKQAAGLNGEVRCLLKQKLMLSSAPLNFINFRQLSHVE